MIPTLRIGSAAAVACTFLAAACTPLAGAAEPEALAAPAPHEILQRMRESYAALGSYADNGVVLTELQSIGAPVITERHRFTTRFAAPRRFFFDFLKHADAERFVVWSPGERFHSWWSATGVHEQYAQGEGASAFAVGASPTLGAVLLIPSLLFQQAGLQSPLLGFDSSEPAGSEALHGRLHYKLTGAVRLNHWSTATRPMTVWIDAETNLVGKVFEDTPTGAGAEVVDRTTTIIEPVAGAPSDEKSFRFSPPP